MKGKLFVVVAVVIVIMLAFAVIAFTPGNEWTTDWEGTEGDAGEKVDDATGSVKGTWGEEIIIIYSDGTNESLKILKDQIFPFAVQYDEKDIVEVRYLLAGTATGDGYDICEIDISELEITEYLTKYPSGEGPPEIISETSYEYENTRSLAVNGDKGTVAVIITDVESGFDGEASGEYGVSYSIKGKINESTIRYRGLISGTDTQSEWKSALLPEGKWLVVTVTAEDGGDNWIELDLESSAPTD